MARTPYPDPKTLSPETQELLGKLPPLNIFRMMAGGEGLLQAFVRLGNHLLAKSKLDPVLREIAIIRVGVLSKARYEVFQHERIARRLGMSDALIAAIHAGADDAAFDDAQRLVVRYTDDVVHNVRASDTTFAPLAARLSLQELQELTVTIGYYMTASRFLENFDVDIEDGQGDAAKDAAKDAARDGAKDGAPR
jgi:4-carboxymuconolactone decarboxylase